MTKPAAEALLEPKLVGDITGRSSCRPTSAATAGASTRSASSSTTSGRAGDRPYYLQPVVVKEHGDDVGAGRRPAAPHDPLPDLPVHDRARASRASGADVLACDYETRDGQRCLPRALDPERSQREHRLLPHLRGLPAASRRGSTRMAHRRDSSSRTSSTARSSSTSEVIWYEAPDDVDSTDALHAPERRADPADRRRAGQGAAAVTQLGEPPGHRPRPEIAAQWDSIERDLRDPEVWAFVTGSGRGRRPTSACCSTRSPAVPTGRERPPFHTFETLRDRIASEPRGVLERGRRPPLPRPRLVRRPRPLPQDRLPRSPSGDDASASSCRLAEGQDASQRSRPSSTSMIRDAPRA